MESLNFKDVLENCNIPVFIFNLSNSELSYNNVYSQQFDWEYTHSDKLFKNWTELKEEFEKVDEITTELQCKNDKRKRFIFEFTLKKINQFIFCFGENKTEINEHKLMIKSFTTMVEQANKKIKQKSIELENILNTMRQATFMVNKDLLIEEPVSAFSKNIFEQEILDHNINSLLYSHIKLNGEQSDKLKSALATTFGEDELQWELMSDYFPTEACIKIKNKNKYLSIATYPIWNDSKLVDKLMLVIQDLTEINLLKDENKEKDEKVKIIQELAEQEPKDISQYFRSSLKLLAQSKGIIEVLEKNPPLIEDIFRNMHTLKGNSRLFNLSIMSESAHEVENTIKAVREKGLTSDDLYKELEEGHKNVAQELARYSKIAKDIFKIAENDLSEHLQNLIQMLLEIECHLLASSEKSLGHIDTALVACSSWALAIDDDIISSYLFEINRLVLNENFKYEDHEEIFTEKINELIEYIFENFDFTISADLDYESNALSFILELAQICIGESKKMRSPILRALYINSSSVVLRKIYELKVLNNKFDNKLILNSLGFLANTINNSYPNFIKTLKEKALFLNIDTSFIENYSNTEIIPCSFKIEHLLLNSKPKNNIQHKNILEIYNSEIDDLLDYLDQTDSLSKEELFQKIQNLTFDSVKSRILKFKNLIEGIAFNSKKQCQYIVKGQDFRISPDKCNLLMDGILHIITNSIDHGIEVVQDRKEFNKDEIGFIEVILNQNNDFFQITITDDGRGINSELVYEKALKLGLISPNDKLNDQQKLNLIFLSGLSTKDVVNETSGRGIGMNVVENNLKLINANIEILSNIGKGSIFTINIPRS